MARESRQSANNLVRSSSPIGLAEVIRPLKPRERKDQSTPEQGSNIGPGLESSFRQVNSRPLWGAQTSRLRQGAELRKQTKDTGDTVRKNTAHKSRILALDLGEESVEVPKKLDDLKQKKNLLLQEGDWLGATKNNNEEEEESSIGYNTELQEEEFNFEGENEGDGAILLGDEEVDELSSLPGNPLWQNAPLRGQQGRNCPPESLDGNDSIFLEVGNVQFSKGRKKLQNQPLVREEFTLPEAGGSENDVSTSESMLLNFEDGVLPLMLEGTQEEPVREALIPQVHGTQVEDSSNPESFFTWSSSSYAGKNGRSSTPVLPMVGDFVNVDDTSVPQSLLGFSPKPSPHFSDVENMTSRARSSPALPTRGPVNTAEDISDQIVMQHLHEFAHSEDEIQNSSLDAFASSVVAGEGQSDDGQWLDMILNEYYWGAKEDSYTDPNVEVQEQHSVVEGK